MNSPRFCRWILALVVGLTGPFVRCAAAALSPAESTFFENKIRPILVDQCYQCHSQGSERIKGELLLDTREGVLKGGKSGPLLVPGQPDKSRLMQAVRYQDKDLQMPPNDRKLSDAQIAVLAEWIKMGAPDPRVTGPGGPGGSGRPTGYPIDFTKARLHWAFQPVRRPIIPDADPGSPWGANPIDRLVWEKLRAKGLQPSPAADKVTLIRRASFDLTGLPPTQQEVADFVADASPKAFVKVVDRLLESPRYGERWGRFWLDLSHFADTKGPVGNNAETRYLYAYTYRDYVIRSFNEDLPYDQFLLQQIAADQLPLGDDKRPLAALGFLTLNNRYNNQANDAIDDRIELVCKSTLALTVTCARCHDHKFDPIPTRDYYSLHGVFNSCTEPAEGPLLETPAETPAYHEFQKQLATREAAVTRFQEETARQLAAEIREKGGAYLLALHEFAHATNGLARDGFIQRKGLNRQLAAAWDRSLKGWRKKHHPIFAPWFAFAELPESDFATQARALAAKFHANADPTQPINPLIAHQFGTAPSSISQVAARYSVVFTEVDRQWQSLLATAAAEKKRAATPPAEPASLPDAAAEEVRKMLYAKGSPTYVDDQRIQELIGRDNKLRDQLSALRKSVNDLKASHPGSPARAPMLLDAAQPKDSAVFLRGNPGSKGPVVPRQFLQILAGDDRKPFQTGSGRLELARAIARRENPLTSRVLVNRVWLHHFGEGLVRTPDDFGTRSEPPTHPELLDYLASQFVDDGWSLKKLHRAIMLSGVYQQSADDNPRFAQIDPENRYLWQMNRRRLDFEALRDTILSIGGTLDLTMGGPSVRLNTEPYSTRRSVYGYIDRNNLPNLLLAFDFANPDLTTGKRDNTIVPQQALFMMNSPLVVEQARALVRRSDFRQQAQNDGRIALLYQLIYQRAPTATELRLALDFVQADAPVAGEPGRTGSAGWDYGYGEFDPISKRTKDFVLMSTFTGKAWQPAAKSSEAQLGKISLTAGGGMPGNKFAAIRRWTAPRDGFVAIDGVLSHGGKEGDGVQGRIVSSRFGAIGQWVVLKNKFPTKLPRLLVQRGDTLDFVVDSRSNPLADNFSWAPKIHLSPTQPGADGVVDWDAREDFGGPENLEAKDRLNGWEKFAQVLLETNELTFVN